MLPEDENFLRVLNENLKIKIASGHYLNIHIIGDSTFLLTDNVVKNIEKYNLYNIKISLTRYPNLLKESQLSLLRIKYKAVIDKNIKLPQKGFMSEDSEYAIKI